MFPGIKHEGGCAWRSESDNLLQLYLASGGFVADPINQDVRALQVWLRSAWRQLADPSVTAFDRREVRNYMKEAEAALRAGLQRRADQELLQKQNLAPQQRPDFRILQLELFPVEIEGTG